MVLPFIRHQSVGRHVVPRCRAVMIKTYARRVGRPCAIVPQSGGIAGRRVIAVAATENERPVRRIVNPHPKRRGKTLIREDVDRLIILGDRQVRASG